MQHRLTAATAARFAAIALGHVTREYPHKLDHVMEGPEDVLGAARAPPDLLRQLRLAQLRPRLVAAAARRCGCSRTWPKRGGSGRWLDDDADAGEGGGRARLSRPRLYGRVRAALWLGVAADAPRRGAARTRTGLGRGAGAARRGLRRPVQGLSAQAHLSDPRRRPLQHRLRPGPRARLGATPTIPALGGADPRARARTIMAATAPARPGSRAATNSSRPRWSRRC